MKKLMLLCMLVIWLSGADIVPTKADFQACYKKFSDSVVYVDGMFGVVVKPNLVIVPKIDKKEPKHYIKYDPYLRLYLVRSSSALVPVRMKNANKMKNSSFVGVLDGNDTKIGHIKAFSNYLGDLDSLNFTNDKPGILMSPCCFMVGLVVGSNKFIGSRYIENFIKTSEISYGDLGVKFIKKDNKIYVDSLSPFGRGNVFMKGDEIISLNGEKPNSISQINDAILFTSNDKDLRFVINRKGVELSFIIKSANSLKKDQKPISKPNGIITTHKKALNKQKSKTVDYNLRFFGVRFDKQMRITSVASESIAQKDGLIIGDRLLEIDMKRVKSVDEVMKILEQKPNTTHYFLFDRDNFQFFVKVEK